MERNKENTKKRILSAVRVLLLKHGISGIGINAVARQAGVDKKLIYRYFGNLDELLTEFLSEEDHWHALIDNMAGKLAEANDININHLIDYFFDKQFDLFYHNKMLRQIMLWSVSETDGTAIEEMIAKREKAGRPILEKIEERIPSIKFNYRAIAAILLAGTYFLTLRARAVRSTFCGVDLNDELGQQEIKSAIQFINRLVLDAAEKEH